MLKDYIRALQTSFSTVSGLRDVLIKIFNKLDEIEFTSVDVFDRLTLSTDATFQTSKCSAVKEGNCIDIYLRFTTPSTSSSDKVLITLPDDLKPNTPTAVFLTPIYKVWAGEVSGLLAISGNDIVLGSNAWKTSTDCVAHISYRI